MPASDQTGTGTPAGVTFVVANRLTRHNIVVFDHDATRVQDHADRLVEDSVLSLASREDAPAVAREFLASHRDHVGQELFYDAQLLVSELMTNAVAHGRTPIDLRVCATHSEIVVAVADAVIDIASDRVLEPVSPMGSATSGRGLAIVNALATSWGVDPAAPQPGKTVWFELRASRRTKELPAGDLVLRRGTVRRCPRRRRQVGQHNV